MTLSVGLWKDPIVCPPLYGGSFGGLSWPLSPVSEGSNSSNWAFGIPSRRTAGGKGSAVANSPGVGRFGQERPRTSLGTRRPLAEAMQRRKCQECVSDCARNPCTEIFPCGPARSDVLDRLRCHAEARLDRQALEQQVFHEAAERRVSKSGHGCTGDYAVEGCIPERAVEC